MEAAGPNHPALLFHALPRKARNSIAESLADSSTNATAFGLKQASVAASAMYGRDHLTAAFAASRKSPLTAGKGTGSPRQGRQALHCFRADYFAYACRMQRETTWPQANAASSQPLGAQSVVASRLLDARCIKIVRKRPLGHGAFSHVYHATYQAVEGNRDVALKVLSEPASAPDWPKYELEKYEVMFLREADLLSRLEHRFVEAKDERMVTHLKPPHVAPTSDVTCDRYWP